MIVLNIRADLAPLHRAISDLGAKQIPFAEALALTRLAQGVSAQESEAVVKTFDHPTPFTQRAFYVKAATKSRPIAFVAVKDIQAQYLAPYVIGGPRSLGAKRAMLVPRDIALNQYGNLPRNKLQALKGKPGVFVGKITTKDGKTISGLWQRDPRAAAKGIKRVKGIVQSKAGLKLLIQFEDTTRAPKHLPFEERARSYVKANAAREFQAALAQGVATARR